MNTNNTVQPEPFGVPIAVIAAETGVTVDDLAVKLGADVFVDPASGLRVVAASTCRRIIDEHHAGVARRAAAMIANEARILATQPKPIQVVPDEHLTELADSAFARGGQR